LGGLAAISGLRLDPARVGLVTLALTCALMVLGSLLFPDSASDETEDAD